MVLIQGKDPYFLIIHVQSKCACYMQLCKYFMGQGLPKRLEGEKVKSLSRVRLFATPWTIAYQAPPSMGFSRQECWNGLPFPSPGDLPDPGIEPRSPALQADALPSEPPGRPHGSVIKKKKKNLPANAGNTGNSGSIPGSGRSPGDGNGNPLQYSCLENSMNRGAWQGIVHGVTESDTTKQPTHIGSTSRALLLSEFLWPVTLDPLGACKKCQISALTPDPKNQNLRFYQEFCVIHKYPTVWQADMFFPMLFLVTAYIIENPQFCIT